MMIFLFIFIYFLKVEEKPVFTRIALMELNVITLNLLFYIKFLIKNLVHFLDQIVNVLFSVTKVTTLDKVVGNLVPASSWATQLNRVQVVVNGLKVVTDGINFVHQIFDAVDAHRAHALFNDGVVGDLDSLAVDLDGTSLVDHVFDGALGWVAPSDEWIADSQHLDASFVQPDENGVTDLSQPQKLKGLLWFWRELVDTSDPDDQSEFWLVWNVKVTGFLGGCGVVDQGFGFGFVLGGVCSRFADDFSLFGERGFL